MLSHMVYLGVGDLLKLQGYQDTGTTMYTALTFIEDQQRSEVSYMDVAFITTGNPPAGYPFPGAGSGSGGGTGGQVNTSGTVILGTECGTTTSKFGIGAIDLGIPYSRAPYFQGDKSRRGMVFGDAFTGDAENSGTFIHSPLLYYSDNTPLPATILFNGCFGSGDPRLAGSIVPTGSGEVTKICNDAWMGPTGSKYPGRTFVHYVSVNTWSPASGSDGTNYSALCYSDNDGATWTDSAITWPGDTQGTAQSANMVMSIVDQSAVDGYFYVFRKRWGRSNSGGPMLTRYSDILNSSSWSNWYYDGTNWVWGTAQDSTPLLDRKSVV